MEIKGQVNKESGRDDPEKIAVEALEPTSGRKMWKLRHKKRIGQKTYKRFNNGFQGAA
jgi:hypothetical protein